MADFASLTSLPSTLEAIFLERKRSIQSAGGRIIIPDVTISELHSDSVTVTRHPVDTGASISDHAFRNPAQLVCEFGWSDSSTLLNSAIASVTSGFTKGLVTIKEVYEDLRQIMDDRELLTVSTGKRQYQNMLITNLKVSTTVDTEASLICEIAFEEVILVEVQTRQLAEINQKFPAKTAQPLSMGRQMPRQLPNGVVPTRLIQPPELVP